MGDRNKSNIEIEKSTSSSNGETNTINSSNTNDTCNNCIKYKNQVKELQVQNSFLKKKNHELTYRLMQLEREKNDRIRLQEAEEWYSSFCKQTNFITFWDVCNHTKTLFYYNYY